MPHRRAGRRARWRVRLGLAAAAALAMAGVATIHQSRAYADAHAPPSFKSLKCPAAQYPPAGYPLNGKPKPYEIPFKGIIFGGVINLPPLLRVPNIYASLCGLVQLPQLSGTIAGSDVLLAPHSPNLYIAGLEALPAQVTFGNLVSTIDLTPAHNGGLDITVTGSTNSSVSTLGMTCGITLNAKFTTLTDGTLSGRPVTGPTKNGQAEVVSNSFPVPAVPQTNSCPPAIAQTFNRLLRLPVRPGVGTFTAPFCFDFELQGINTPLPNAQCPWPGS